MSDLNERILDDRPLKAGFMNDRELAKWLAVALATVRRWRLLGQGPLAHRLQGSVRYRVADVEAWIHAQPVLGRAVGVTQ